MNMLNVIGPSIDPGDTLVTGLQLGFMPLIITIWAQPVFNPPH